MNPLSIWGLVAVAALIPLSAGGADANPTEGRNMTYDFNSIMPATDLNWTPCFDNYTCARLEVPLDYTNTSVGTTAIAFMKLAAQHSPESAENILLNGGGPGISGVGQLFQVGSQLSQYVDSEYNLVGFDPRAINNSGPSVDCFSKNPDAQMVYKSLFYSETSNASSTSLETQFYAADIFGKSCSYSIGQNRSQMYISTPLVAQDMLTYAKAEQRAAGKSESDAKLWYFGQSYGTVLGATFASLFPNSVGRLVLDGVVDAEDYYNNGWRTNLYQTDEAVYSFSATCHQSGPQNCSFWGPSPKNITHRINNILADLKYHPVPKTGLSGQYTPGLATYSDLKQLMLLAVYFPLSYFPLLSDIFTSIESGNSSVFMGASDLVSGVLVSDDASLMIKCIDGYGRSNYSTIEDYETYVELLEHQSHYLGEAWPVNSDGVLCRSVDLQVPNSTIFQGPLPPSSNQTSFPLLFVSNTIDPVGPIIGAYKMTRAFPGSTVLIQEGVGHTASLNDSSTCLWTNINMYLGGKMPPANLKCKQELFPFRDPGTSVVRL